MRRLLLSIIGLVAAYGLFMSLAASQATQGSTNSSTNSAPSDHRFLTQVMQTNVAEIELAKLAQEYSHNPRVNKFAGMLVKDDVDALNRLHQAAADLGIEVKPDEITPTKEDEELKNRLAKLSGSSFDHEYVDAMVQKHEKAVQDFEVKANSQQGSTSTGREKPAPAEGEGRLQSLARDLLPTLRTHLSDAKALRDQMGGK